MLTQEDISHQKELLNIYRTNLKHLILQAARYGGEAVSPLPVINDINQTRTNISRTKELLRSNGITVEDHPDDISSIGKTLEEAVSKQSSQINKAEQSQVLRRAQHATSVLQGAQILWVDDKPENNIYERRLLRSLGVFVDLARSTEEAFGMLQDTHYDVIISDIGRHGIKDEGLRFLSEMRQRGINRSLIFYTWGVDPNRGTPAHAFAITERTDHLLNYIIDVLERERI